jgi:hypothetical protein
LSLSSEHDDNHGLSNKIETLNSDNFDGGTATADFGIIDSGITSNN